MIAGLKTFREHFAAFEKSYVLIGGSACELNLRVVDAPFRVTKDLDIVLLVETLEQNFTWKFWEFVRAGEYQVSQTSTGEKRCYRFQKPRIEGYPQMLELFSRHPDFMLSGDDVQLTPIPTEDECSSLSAILLDDEYYAFIHKNTIEIEALPIASPLALIVLKAKAWIDLTNRKKSGEAIDGADIRKHKNDIARLSVLLEDAPAEIPTKIKEDMRLFLAAFTLERLDTKALGLVLTEFEIKSLLQRVFV